MPADDEKQELWRKHGRILCDNMANSLKKNSISGYKHVYPVKSGTYSYMHMHMCMCMCMHMYMYRAQVYDIEARKLVHLGYFYTAYAAAVSAALSTTKGLQDQRDATRLSGSLTAEQAEQVALDEGLTLGRNRKLASGFTNVSIQDDGQSTTFPFRIHSELFSRMPSNLTSEYISGAHAALVIARHEAK